MLLGADSVVQTPRLRASDTNERRMAEFSETMDSCFVGRNAAVMQNTQFAYTDESTRRQMTNAANPKPGAKDHERQGAPARSRANCNECETGDGNKRRNS